MTKKIPSVSMNYAANGSSTRSNELGMRAMQSRAFSRRGEQYLLIKSPPASGKSRALMFIALDKLHNQGIKKAIIAVPEKSIGSSFNNEPLTQFGFYWDWEVVPKWNLCNAPGEDGGKVDSVNAFLSSEDRILVCTHATFRFAVDKFGVEAFDECLIAIDEFHHVSANPDNKLGAQLVEFIERDKVHVVAMTGSYFRGDAVPVLMPEDEAKFETVTYTYYEQLNGYTYLKRLDMRYCFYTSGRYTDEIVKVLDSSEKTIVHIPNVNSRESTTDKLKETETIVHALGTWEGTDEDTGFLNIRTPDGRLIKVADLVDDDVKRDRVAAALRSPKMKTDRDYVDMIIALGMAKEGFDWIWCEHALTVGYRSSLTEIVQIVGRTTRDAPGKECAKFTNLIAEPDASSELVTEAVNDTLKAIAASLLMEQVLAPNFNFTPKVSGGLGADGDALNDEPSSDSSATSGGQGSDTLQDEIEISVGGMKEPKSEEAKRICRDDVHELVTSFIQDKAAMERGLFDDGLVPEELTQQRMGAIVREKYPHLDDEDQEAIRQHAIATMILIQKGWSVAGNVSSDVDERESNTSFVDGVKRFAMDVTRLDIDLIDRVNPFGEAYAILAKSMNEDSLKQIKAVIGSKKLKLTEDEARDLAKRALEFKNERGRLPEINSADPWEQRMAEGIAFLQRLVAESKG